MKPLTMACTALLALLVAGCGFTNSGDAIRQGIAEYGARAADEALVNSEWVLCNAAPIGSIKRRYGVSETRAQAYKTLCGAGDNADVIGPAEPPTVTIN